MTLIAINILLDPDAATVEKARATNARLREDFPHGFALDANHAPHITLLQRFVRHGEPRRSGKCCDRSAAYRAFDESG